MIARVRLLLVLVVAVSGSMASFAQELDHTQYYLNLPGINAGFTGIEDYMDTRFSFRQGWNDFAVKNNYTFVSAYGALGNYSRNALSNNTLRLSNPDAYRQTQTEKKLMRKHGIGGMITQRDLGPYQATTLNVNYAYHLPVSSTVNMSFGSRLAFNSQRIDLTNFTLRDQVNDQFFNSILAAGQGNTGSFLMDFGYVIYSPKFYVGLSSNGLISTHVTGSSVIELDQTARVSLQASLTSLRLSRDLTFSPGIRASYLDGYDPIWTAQGRIRFKNLLYIGGGYTNSSPKLSLMFGLNVNGRLSINYAYDKYLSELNNFNVNVHELVIGATLFNRYNAETRLW